MKRLLALALSLMGCRSAFDVCAEVTAQSLGALPAHLSETGLYVDTAETLGPNVLAYTPSFTLWTDGAEKRRWVALPAGATIDNSDPDNWRFPVGTKFWKEFSRDGVRVETRVLLKTGEADEAWVGASYVWREGDADLSLEGAPNARGTEHDVPAADRCFGCHGGRKSRVLGFSSVQLDNGGVPALSELGAMLLVKPQQSFRVPGNPVEHAALGYLYANCSHCHNQDRPEAEPRCFDPDNSLDFSLNANSLTGDVTKTAVYSSVVGQQIRAGKPDQGRVMELISRRESAGIWPNQMPPLGTDVVDTKGIETIREWISAMK